MYNTSLGAKQSGSCGEDKSVLSFLTPVPAPVLCSNARDISNEFFDLRNGNGTAFFEILEAQPKHRIEVLVENSHKVKERLVAEMNKLVTLYRNFQMDFMR